MPFKVLLPTAFTRHTDGQKNFASTAPNLSGLLTEIDKTFPAPPPRLRAATANLPRFRNF